MARIIGGIATSYVPSIGKAIARRLENDPLWKPFFDAYKPVHAWLDDVQPDLAVVVYNDHGLNFFLDKMPTFAVGAAPEYKNADEGWGLPVVAPYPGHPQFSWHLIESLVADEFDITSCQEMLVDHAFTVPMSLLWPERGWRAIPTVPIAINTVQFPLPSPTRCYKLSKAIGRAIESYKEDIRVLVVATDSLSHQLDGDRAGYINKKFDLLCLQKIVNDPDALARYSVHDLVRDAGAQGVELLMWFVMRGAMTGQVTEKHHSYHVPISNTAAAVMVLENNKPWSEKWLESWLGTFIADSRWLFPAIEAVHIVALCIMFGAILMVNLRLLGIAFNDKRVARLARELGPWVFCSLLIILASGLILFSSEAMKAYTSVPFQVKMVFLFAAVVL